MNDEFTTTGAASTYTYTIPTSATEYLRRVISIDCNGNELTQLNTRAIPKLNTYNEVFYRYGDSTITVFDTP